IILIVLGKITTPLDVSHIELTAPNEKLIA
ncbi:unnamed protein product, partial [marine sediment metagenome]